MQFIFVTANKDCKFWFWGMFSFLNRHLFGVIIFVLLILVFTAECVSLHFRKVITDSVCDIRIRFLSCPCLLSLWTLVQIQLWTGTLHVDRVLSPYKIAWVFLIWEGFPPTSKIERFFLFLHSCYWRDYAGGCIMK